MYLRKWVEHPVFIYRNLNRKYDILNFVIIIIHKIYVCMHVVCFKLRWLIFVNLQNKKYLFLFISNQWLISCRFYIYNSNFIPSKGCEQSFCTFCQVIYVCLHCILTRFVFVCIYMYVSGNSPLLIILQIFTFAHETRGGVWQQ